MQHHGTSLDLYHAGLLTVLVLLWRAWFIAARRFGYRVAAVAVVLVPVALIVSGPYAALVPVLWVMFAWDGARQREEPAGALARAFLWAAAKGNRT